jgi:hypothetical protein
VRNMDPYRLPFALDRCPPTYVLTNIGPEILRGVSVQLTGRGVMDAPALTRLLPDDEFVVRVHGDALEIDTAMVVRWIRPDGSEYLWRAVL